MATGDNHLYMPGVSGEYMSAPDISAYDPTTTQRIEARIALTDWTRAADQQNIASQYGATATDWLFRVTTDGKLNYFNGGASKATSTAAVPFADGVIGWVACEVTFGSGDAVVTFETSTDDTNDPDQVSWTELDEDTGLTITDQSFADVLLVGAHQGGANDVSEGSFYRVRIIVDGTTEFDADFTKLTVADLESGTFVEDSSNAATVTLNGTAWAYVRPYNRVDILSSTELLLMANDGNKFHSPKWADRSGNNHHAQNGSAAGADTNDALGKTHDGVQYVFFPGSNSNYLSIPDSAALSVTGSLDLRARIAMDDWTPAGVSDVIAKYTTTGNQRAYKLAVNTDGKLACTTSSDGTNNQTEFSSVATGFANGSRHWIRATYDVSDDDVEFFTADGDLENPTASDFTQLGTTQAGGGFGSVFDSTAEVTLCGLNAGTAEMWAGDLYRAQIYDGIDGTLELDVALADATQPYATFIERSVNAATVTINRSSSGLVSTIIDRDQWLFTTDDFQKIPVDADHPELDFAADEDFTLAAVFRSVDSANNVRLIDKRGSAGSGYFINMRTSEAGYRFHIFDASANTPVTTDTALGDQLLRSIIGRRDTTADDLDIFTDGVVDATSVTDTTTATLATSSEFRIGTSTESADHYEGALMAVALWRSALTAAQITEAHDLLILGPSSFPPVRRDKALAGIIQR